MAPRKLILDPARLEREILGLPEPVMHSVSAVFQPSEMQQNFFEWVANGSGNAILEAVAGAGKTTTLINALALMKGNVVFMAYNKSAAKDIQAKADKAGVLRDGLRISTVHSQGYGAVRYAFKNTVVKGDKSKIMIREIVDGAPDLAPMYERFGTFICKMVSFGKQFMVGLDCQAKTWEEIFEHFSLDQELSEGVSLNTVLPLVNAVYRRSIQTCDRLIDFDDQIFAPLAHGLRLFPQDWVLIDECQDANPAREELAARMLRKPDARNRTPGRFVGVGDDKQSIYGFAGAGGGGLARISKRFRCVNLPLTVSYRCPQSVVRYVQQWNPIIQAAPNAPEGVVRGPFPGAVAASADKAPAWYASEVPDPSSAILCRYTRPLIQTAFGLIRNGVSCKVEGRDIGKGLIALVSRFRVSTLDRLEDKLELWLRSEQAKAQELKSDKREEEAFDKFETLGVFIEKCRARKAYLVTDLEYEINNLFGDDVTASGVVTLASGHKSKGREWPTVYWLLPPPRRQPRKEWEAIEEENIKYVIGTRAMSELVLVPIES